MIVSGKGPQVAPGPLHLPAETFEELLLLIRQQQGFRGILARLMCVSGLSSGTEEAGLQRQRGVSLPSRLARRCRRRKRSAGSYRGNRTYRDHQGTSQVQGPPVDFRSLQVTCGRMNRLQAATSDACLPWMHT